MLEKKFLNKSSKSVNNIDRREFLKRGSLIGAVGACAATFGFNFFSFASTTEEEKLLKSGEKLIRSTCSPNCTGACGWNASVKDGRINTLIQAADYPEKEYNPRGCLKGLSMPNLIYAKDRVKYPLIRVGERGENKFKKVSWEEALDYTAKKLKGIEKKYGSKSVAVTVQVPGTGYVNKGALVSLAGLSKWSIHHGYDQNGDLPIFWPMTFGVQSEELESTEWIKSKYTMVFGSNIIQTRLPDAKHLLKAKKTGKVVVIDPDYCITAAKSDEWIRIKADTDAALALGMSKVIIENNLHDKDFLADFTDMPILVRKDTGKRLLAKDVKSLSAKAKSMEVPDYRSLFVVKQKEGFGILNPEDLNPSGAKISGNFDLTLVDGTSVKVTTIFDELVKGLKDYTLEKVSKITGAPAEQIERIAKEAGGNKPLHVVYGASNYQWYNSDIKGRAISLLVVLTGNIGNSGSGISTYAGQYRIRFGLKKWWAPKGAKLNWVPYLCFLRGEGKNYPKSGIKAMIGAWGNPFDQHNMAGILKDRAKSGDIEFVVTSDFQMTTSCLWSDVIFPASSWYEKWDLTATILHPYLQLQQPVIKPLFESKSELWMFRELAKRLNPKFEKHYFMDLDENEASKKIVKILLENGGPETKGITFEMLRKGPVRLHSPAPGDRQIPFYEQRHEKKPFPPRSYPAPIKATAKFLRSGRIEMYREEDLFLKIGEKLPVYKESYLETEYKVDSKSKVDADARTKHKLRFFTKNSLYRVHSTHSSNPWLLELQDNKPKAYINGEDAKERGIKNDDPIEVYNGRGKLKAYAMIDDGVMKGNLTFYQGWWSQYLQEESYNSLTYPYIKPTHEVYFVPGIWSPTTSWNECLCDIRKV